jgi:hypothetical protein
MTMTKPNSETNSQSLSNDESREAIHNFYKVAIAAEVKGKK